MNELDTTSVIHAREAALVDAQCLIQRALNMRYGNPRDKDTQEGEAEGFLIQRDKFAKLVGRTAFWVSRLFSDHSKMSVKDLAESLHVLGYELKLDCIKKQ